MRIFISYSSRDRPAALQLLKLVEDAGHDAWMDLFDIQPAQRLDHELEEGVRRAEVFCILLSPAAVASKWVVQEIEHARHMQSGGVRILPLILRPCVIPPGLADYVGIDATRGVEEPSVSQRILRFLGGDVADARLFDAIFRAELADRAARDEAETRLPALREDLEAALDEPLRRLTLAIDHDTWPAGSSAVLELVIELDMFTGSAHILLAPYIEGATWRADAGLDERPAEDFFAAEKPRVDARFLWAGRELVLSAALDGTDLGERPLEFAITLDGSEYTGPERATTMVLLERFELPSLRALIDKGSRINLWEHAPGAEPVRVDAATTDRSIALYANLSEGRIGQVRLWSAHHERPARVLLGCPTIRGCATDIEREMLLSLLDPSHLRAHQYSPPRRERITLALERNEDIAPEDRWAAFHLLCGRAKLARQRNQPRPAVEDLHRAVELVLGLIDPGTLRYEEFFRFWSALMLLVRLLASAGGTPQAIRHFADMSVGLCREMTEVNPQEPDFRRALARSLVHRVHCLTETGARSDPHELAQAAAIMTELENPAMPWRAAEAQSLRAQAEELAARVARPS